MKYILLITLLSLSITATAQPNEDTIKSQLHTPEAKNEISILGGQALNLATDWSRVGQPTHHNYYTGINYYRNFGQWQAGAGLNLEIRTTNPATTHIITHKTPHLVANHTYELPFFSFYGGIMFGYSFYNENSSTGDAIFSTSYSIKGHGPTGGIQAGTLIKVDDILLSILRSQPESGIQSITQ